MLPGTWVLSTSYVIYGVVVLLWLLPELCTMTATSDKTKPECKKLAKGEVFPWLIELVLKSVGKNRTFSGELISLRSLITCCVCIEPLNPKVKTMHRIISADLETILAKTVDRSDHKTFQIRYALQTIAEASCSAENERKGEVVKAGVTFVAVIILDMSFFWENTFHFLRMPHLSKQDSITDAIKSIINNRKSDCWCQSQLYVPLAKDFSSRDVNIVIHLKDLYFPAQHENLDDVSNVITGVITSGDNRTMNLGSPLVCNGTVLGVLTAYRLLEREQQMIFVRLDFASVFMTEFLLLERYFPDANTVPFRNPSSRQLPGGLSSLIYSYFTLLNLYLTAFKHT